MLHDHQVYRWSTQGTLELCGWMLQPSWGVLASLLLPVSSPTSVRPGGKTSMSPGQSRCSMQRKHETHGQFTVCPHLGISARGTPTSRELCPRKAWQIISWPADAAEKWARGLRWEDFASVDASFGWETHAPSSSHQSPELQSLQNYSFPWSTIHSFLFFNPSLAPLFYCFYWKPRKNNVIFDQYSKLSLIFIQSSLHWGPTFYFFLGFFIYMTITFKFTLKGLTQFDFWKFLLYSYAFCHPKLFSLVIIIFFSIINGSSVYS